MPGVGIIQAFRQLHVELSPTGCSAAFDLALGRLSFGGSSDCVVSVWFLFGTPWREGVRPSAGHGLLTMSCVCLDGCVPGRAMFRADCAALLWSGLAGRKDLQEFGLQGWPGRCFQPGSSSRHSLRTGFPSGPCFSPIHFSLEPSNQAPQRTWRVWAISPSVVCTPARSLCRWVILLWGENPAQPFPPAQANWPPCSLARQLWWTLKGGEDISFIQCCPICVQLGEERESRRAELVWPPTAISVFLLVKGSLIFTLF